MARIDGVFEYHRKFTIETLMLKHGLDLKFLDMIDKGSDEVSDFQLQAFLSVLPT